MALSEKPRPVNLDLRTIRFPVHAIASILHRISGVLLFLLIPFFLWIMQRSITSPESYAELHQQLTKPCPKLIIWGLMVSFAYHFFAGIRHLIMDLGYLESLNPGRWSARIVIALALIVAVFAGVWLW